MNRARKRGGSRPSKRAHVVGEIYGAGLRKGLMCLAKRRVTFEQGSKKCDEKSSLRTGLMCLAKRRAAFERRSKEVSKEMESRCKPKRLASESDESYIISSLGGQPDGEASENDLFGGEASDCGRPGGDEASGCAGVDDAKMFESACRGSLYAGHGHEAVVDPEGVGHLFDSLPVCEGDVDGRVLGDRDLGTEPTIHGCSRRTRRPRNWQHHD